MNTRMRTHVTYREILDRYLELGITDYAGLVNLLTTFPSQSQRIAGLKHLLSLAFSVGFAHGIGVLTSDEAQHETPDEIESRVLRLCRECYEVTVELAGCEASWHGSVN